MEGEGLMKERGYCNWKLSEILQNILGGIFHGFLPFSSLLSMSYRAERRGVEERSRQRKFQIHNIKDQIS